MNTPVIVHISITPTYEFKGYVFDFHRYCGPLLCRKDGEPRARQPGARSAFWAVIEEWNNLSAEQKKATLWKGESAQLSKQVKP